MINLPKSAKIISVIQCSNCGEEATVLIDGKEIASMPPNDFNVGCISLENNPSLFNWQGPVSFALLLVYDYYADATIKEISKPNCEYCE